MPNYFDLLESATQRVCDEGTYLIYTLGRSVVSHFRVGVPRTATGWQVTSLRKGLSGTNTTV